MARSFQDGVEVGVSPDVAMRALRAAVAGVATDRSVHVDGWTVTATVRASIWSWGERVEGRVEASETGSRVQVHSKCRAQLFDWGKNRRNVERILRLFAQAQPQP